MVSLSTWQYISYANIKHWVYLAQNYLFLLVTVFQDLGTIFVTTAATQEPLTEDVREWAEVGSSICQVCVSLLSVSPSPCLY